LSIAIRVDTKIALCDDNPMSSPDPDPANPTAVAQRAERRLARLEEMAELGMQLLRELPKPTSEAEAPRIADAFARISRAVRLTLALEEKTDLFLVKLAAGVAPAAGEDAAAMDDDEDCQWLRGIFWEKQTRQRIAVGARISEAIDAEIADEEAAKSLYLELDERLSDREACKRILDWPLRECIERLCRDLKFEPDWNRWEDCGWAPGYAPAKPLWREQRYANRDAPAPLASANAPPSPSPEGRSPRAPPLPAAGKWENDPSLDERLRAKVAELSRRLD
jgi:hypothetical protein